MRKTRARSALALPVALALGWLPATACKRPLPEASGVSVLVEKYLEEYFAHHPSKSTAAGRHDRDGELEDWSPARRASWLATQHGVQAELARLTAAGGLSRDEELDAELLLRQVRVEELEHGLELRPEQDPLFWTQIAGNATVFLLVQDDLPATQRLASAAARARLLPRLASQARASLEATDPAQIVPAVAEIAAAQARASATFYRDGFAAAAGGDSARVAELGEAGAMAAPALEELAAFLGDLAARASRPPQLGAEAYGERFRRITGLEQPPSYYESQAVVALVEKIKEAAAFGRSVWPELMPGESPPAEDRLLLAALFSRVSEDRASTTDELVADYKNLVIELERFLRRRDLITLPDPLTLVTDRSPSYFVGQSVGGVYPAGPFAPEAKTLFYLPTPADTASSAQREAFFRDFNHHFNVMITPHEILPGHYLQLKWAARHPRKIRALFPDGIYVEGWGTFCERLLLDEGWGGPLDRLAHFKKQLENIARTIVDIRVHSRGWGR